jgi:hypothetical protein
MSYGAALLPGNKPTAIRLDFLFFFFYPDCCLLGCKFVWFGMYVPVFRRKLLPPSSVLKNDLIMGKFYGHTEREQLDRGLERTNGAMKHALENIGPLKGCFPMTG